MDEYETIERAKRLLAENQTMLSDRTVRGYEANYSRLWKRASLQGNATLRVNDLIDCAKQTKSASTWFGRRAALLYMLRRTVAHLDLEQDKMQCAMAAAQVPLNAPQWAQWKALVLKIKRALVFYEQLKNEAGPPIEDRQPRHSKRQDLRGLPEDWRERIVARLPKYRQAVLVEAVTGCRPDELVTGVKLAIVDGNLIVDIPGAKVTATSGQPWRRLMWPINNESNLVKMLVQEVQEGLTFVSIANARAYSGAMRAAGLREWPGRRASVTPYLLRHAASADMKAAGVEELDISAALGHCVDVAKQTYGTWKQGKRRQGVAPKSITAARPVRRVAKPTRTPKKSPSGMKPLT